jgi:hypothetical protein
MAHKRKFIEGDRVRVRDYESADLWEVYAVRKIGRKTRYSVKKLETPAIMLICNIKGSRLEKMEEK